MSGNDDVTKCIYLLVPELLGVSFSYTSISVIKKMQFFPENVTFFVTRYQRLRFGNGILNSTFRTKTKLQANLLTHKAR